MTKILEKTMVDIEEYAQEHDAIVFMGCGGDLQQWVDGITDMLKECDIVPRDFEFSFAWRFTYREPLTIICLLFPIDGKGLNIGKLSIWRIENQNLDAKWLSDFLVQRRASGRNSCPMSDDAWRAEGRERISDENDELERDY